MKINFRLPIVLVIFLCGLSSLANPWVALDRTVRYALAQGPADADLRHAIKSARKALQAVNDGPSEVTYQNAEAAVGQLRGLLFKRLYGIPRHHRCVQDLHFALGVFLSHAHDKEVLELYNSLLGEETLHLTQIVRINSVLLLLKEQTFFKNGPVYFAFLELASAFGGIYQYVADHKDEFLKELYLNEADIEEYILVEVMRLNALLEEGMTESLSMLRYARPPTQRAVPSVVEAARMPAAEPAHGLLMPVPSRATGRLDVQF